MYFNIGYLNVTDCYWMLDAIMEYFSTGNIPHVFLEDNVIIDNNMTSFIVAQRLENNELYR